MDALSVGIGVIIGVIITFFVVEIGMRKIFPWSESSRLTSVWDLNEIKGIKPLLIVCENIEQAVEFPKESNIVLKNKETATLIKHKNVVVNQNVNANFVIGEDRALIFSGYIKKDAFVIWTSNEKIITRLSAEFNKLWREGK